MKAFLKIFSLWFIFSLSIDAMASLNLDEHLKNLKESESIEIEIPSNSNKISNIEVGDSITKGNNLPIKRLNRELRNQIRKQNSQYSKSEIQKRRTIKFDEVVDREKNQRNFKQN